jgi:hypothetical protein
MPIKKGVKISCRIFECEGYIQYLAIYAFLLLNTSAGKLGIQWIFNKFREF